MKIEFNLEMTDHDNMHNQEKVKLSIVDATHVQESNGDKLHSFELTYNGFTLNFTIDDDTLSGLVDVLLMRLNRNG